MLNIPFLNKIFKKKIVCFLTQTTTEVTSERDMISGMFWWRRGIGKTISVQPASQDGINVATVAAL